MITHTHTHACMHACTYARTHVHMHTRTHARTHSARACTHTHTHTHTHLTASGGSPLHPSSHPAAPVPSPPSHTPPAHLLYFLTICKRKVHGQPQKLPGTAGCWSSCASETGHCGASKVREINRLVMWMHDLYVSYERTVHTILIDTALL